MIANFEEVCCIALSEARQAKVRKLIDSWLEKRPPDDRGLKVDPTELAKLLGFLVFASQVVPGGRTYMQGMLAQFQGLEVDWRRGMVRPTRAAKGDGQWSQVEISAGFWRDLEWWSDCFEKRNCTALSVEAKAEAAITGTDASDWGTGQLAWIDGGREETVLRFGSAEQRRSINWRELLGVLRVVEQYGSQLKGRKILLETDNTSAKGAAEKGFSKAEDMQELTRRLLEAATKHDIEVRFTHTPGAKLDRPDQTSRGDPVAEPRVRMQANKFGSLLRRFGPFTEFVGAERQHAASGSAERTSDSSVAALTPGADGQSNKISSEDTMLGPRVWMHPTFSTVGSALRLLSSRLMASDGERAKGVVVLPDHPTAQWFSFMKYFNIVGRLPEGDKHLEMSQWGSWKTVSSQRPTLIATFPRAAGIQVKPVRVVRDQVDELGGDSSAPPEGYAMTPKEGGWHLPAMKGSMLYSPAPTAGGHGELFIVWDTFDPIQESDLVGGKVDVKLAELVNVESKATKGERVRRSKEYVISNQLMKDKYGTRPASFSKVGSVPWHVDSQLLWAVDHLVGERAPSVEPPKLKGKAGQAAQWAQKAFAFDFAEAERQIAYAKGHLSNVLGHPEERSKQPHEEVPDIAEDCEVQSVSPQVEETTSGIRSLVLAGAGGRVMEAVRAIEIADAAEDLERAKTSAHEAAAARVHRDPFAEPGGKSTQVAQLAGRVLPHVCRYPDMECAGCGELMQVGTLIVPSGKGMAHKNGACAELAKAKLLQEVHERREARAKRGDANLQSAKREAQLAHRFSDSRLAMVMKCLDGNCKAHGEERLMCRGARGADGKRVPCGRGLHAKTCAMVSSYHAQTCIMVCVSLRVLQGRRDGPRLLGVD